MATSDISSYVGDTTVLEVKIYKNSELLDLTEYLVLFTVKQPFVGSINSPSGSDGAAVIKKNSDTDGGISKISTGLVRVTINATDTNSLLAGQYLYDVQISKQGTPTTVFTVISGNITFSNQITSRISAE